MKGTALEAIIVIFQRSNFFGKKLCSRSDPSSATRPEEFISFRNFLSSHFFFSHPLPHPIRSFFPPSMIHFTSFPRPFSPLSNFSVFRRASRYFSFSLRSNRLTQTSSSATDGLLLPHLGLFFAQPFFRGIPISLITVFVPLSAPQVLPCDHFPPGISVSVHDFILAGLKRSLRPFKVDPCRESFKVL